MHEIQATKINPVYLDKNSGLDKSQRETLNTILFNHYRRFKRNSAVVEADEPLVLKNFAYFTKNIQSVVDKSYGDIHTISFILRTKGMNKDSEIEIGELNGEPPSVFFQAGGSGLTSSENLPGYFYMKGQKLMFKQSVDLRYNNYYQAYIYWSD